MELIYMVIGLTLGLVVSPALHKNLEWPLGVLDRKLDLILERHGLRDGLRSWQKLARSRSSSKLRVIRAYMDETGVTLRLAKRAVEDWVGQHREWPLGVLDRKLDLILDQRGIRDGLRSWQRVALSASSSKPQVIRAYMDETGANLRVAKQAVKDWIGYK